MWCKICDGRGGCSVFSSDGIDVVSERCHGNGFHVWPGTTPSLAVGNVQVINYLIQYHLCVVQ